MSVNTNDVSLNTSSHVQINRAKLRMMGTFLVPIVCTLFVFGFFLFFLFCFGFSSTSEYNQLVKGYGVIQWGHLSFYPLKILTSSMGRVSILVITFMILYKIEKLTPKNFGLVWSVGQGVWRDALSLNLKIIVFLILLFTTILNLAYHFFGSETLNSITNLLHNCYGGKIKITFHVSAPFFEEVLFRGIYCTLLVRYGLKWRYTILITGIAFGLIHLVNNQPHVWGYVMQVSFATIVGWFLGWIFYKTRTLVLPVIWHYVINIFIYFGALRPDILAKIANHLII